MQTPKPENPKVVSMSIEMITVAARIPLDDYRALQAIGDSYGWNNSQILRAAVAEFVHQHKREHHDETRSD
jgi:hypothetical protein